MRKLGTLLCLAAAAACGEVKGGTDPDGPPAGEDAPPDTGPLPVKITVLSTAGDGAPDLTAKLVYQDPAGTVVLDGTVDAMGKSEAMLPMGGSVTVIRITLDTTTALRATITTITGVKAGDELIIGPKARPTVKDQGGQTTMNANYTLSTGADGHVFYTTCGATSSVTTSPVTLTFRDSCHGQTFDLVGVATVPAPGTPRYVRLNDVAYSNGGSFTIPGSFSTMSNFTVNAQNVPDEVSNLTVTRSTMLDHVAVAPQTLAVGDPAAGAVAAIVPYPPLAGARAEVQLRYSRSDALGEQFHEVHTAAVASSIAVDFNQQRVPWLATPMSSVTGASWSIAVPGDAPDGALTTWLGRWVTEGRSVITAWRVVHAPNPTGITLPRLPQAYAALDPQAQTSSILLGTATTSVVDYDVIDGYDKFRLQADTLTVVQPDDMGAFAGMPFQRRMYRISF